jgi:hypothetical protein
VSLRSFVERQSAVGPGGVIRIRRDASTGACEILQTDNLGNEQICGRTHAHKCEFGVCPAWYWPLPQGCSAEGLASCHGGTPPPVD